MRGLQAGSVRTVKVTTTEGEEVPSNGGRSRRLGAGVRVNCDAGCTRGCGWPWDSRARIRRAISWQKVSGQEMARRRR